MARHLRFAVHQRVQGQRRQVGLFAAAYFLQHEGELFPHDRVRLDELLDWFEDELPAPPKGLIPERAIFWYVKSDRFSGRMWDLSQLLTEYGFTTQLLTAVSIGCIVYEDEFQRAAVPPRRRVRSAWRS